MLRKYRKPRMRRRRNVQLDREIGDRVRRAREKKQIQQAELGRQLDKVSPVSMWKYEEGQTGLDASLLAKLSTLLDVSLDWLISGQERSGLDPILADEERERVYDQFQASPQERAAFDEHLREYVHHRITTSYVVAFLLGLRKSSGNVAQATDAAVLAVARDVGVDEREGRPANPDSLRRKPKPRAKRKK
jgi:transcriptional regulator with XRE-family HTH domain